MKASVWIRSPGGQHFRLDFDGDRLANVSGSRNAVELGRKLRWRADVYGGCVPHGNVVRWLLSSLAADGFEIMSRRPDSKTEWLACRR